MQSKKCITTKCRKIAKNGNYCYSCVIRKWKLKNPEKYCYYVLRNNARARGKIFTITFEEFLEVAIKFNYFKGKGRSATSLHIDRKREDVGYVKGNIQVLTNTANFKKFLSWSHDEKGKPTQFKFSQPTKINEQETYPF